MDRSRGLITLALDALMPTYRRHPHDRDLLFALAPYSRDRGRMQDAVR